MSTFITADENGNSGPDGEASLDAFLSGSITDAQSRYNLNNLVLGGKAVPADVRMLRRLFENIGVAPDLANAITVGLRDAGGGIAADPGAGTGGSGTGGTGGAPGTGGSTNDGSATPAGGNAANPGSGGGNSGSGTGTGSAGGNGNGSGTTDADAQLLALNLPPVAADPPLLPQSLKQLQWLGLDEDTIARIAPHVTLLPAKRRTTINLNTASRELIAAAIDKLDLAGAQSLVQARERKAFENLADASKLVPGFTLDSSRVGVASDYFEVRGRLRLGDRLLDERSLVWRNQRDVQILSRERSSSQDKLP